MFWFWLGGTAPQIPRFLAGGAKPPRYLAFDRGGPTGPPRSHAFFLGTADDTGAAYDRPTTVRRPSGNHPTTDKNCG